MEISESTYSIFYKHRGANDKRETTYQLAKGKHNLEPTLDFVKDSTQKITEFSYGVSDRGASIRIPIYTVEHNWNGYLEDRRPASNADPYKIISHIVGTLTS